MLMLFKLYTVGVFFVVLGFVCCDIFTENNEVLQEFKSETSKKPMKIRLPRDRPNIILIMADDMGWGDIGANWPKTVDTPNIDLLAKQGLRLTDFHAGASVCTPSRAALLTGRLGLRTGIVVNFGEGALGGIPVNETTLGEVMIQAGYRTAMLGKWHLGVKPGHHPLDKGFQSYLGVPYSLDMGCADPAGRDLPQCPSCPKGEDVCSVEQECPSSGCFQDLALPLYENRSIVHQPVQLSTVATMYAEFAANFIKNSSMNDEPYFLYAALSHIHVPLAHAARFDNITGRGVFADTLRELDWLVGKIVSTATKWNSNTLIWFTSDNGPWAVKCDLAGSGGPFTGDWQRKKSEGGGGSAAKMTVWEAGHRVPAIVYWPPYVEAGTVSDALVSALDILPTLARVANATLPSNRYFDGQNMLPVILGFDEKGHQELFHPNSGAGGPDGEIGAVRFGPYKVVFYSGGTPDCSGHAGPVQTHLKEPLVFHLASDPAEKFPLDPSSWDYQAVVWKTKQALFTLRANIRADNTSTVDYRTQKSARPCCDSKSAACRCPWD